MNFHLKKANLVAGAVGVSGFVSQAALVRTTCCKQRQQESKRKREREREGVRGAERGRGLGGKKREGEKVPGGPRFFPRLVSQRRGGEGSRRGPRSLGSFRGAWRDVGAKKGPRRAVVGILATDWRPRTCTRLPREPKLRADSQGRTYSARAPLALSAARHKSAECIPRIVISHGAGTEKVMHLARQYFFLFLFLFRPAFSVYRGPLRLPR